MSDDKTEEPTEAKLEKAREKGQVAKSEDLTHAASMLGAAAALMMFGDTTWTRLKELAQKGLTFGDGDLRLIELYQRSGAMAVDALFIVVPVVLAGAVFSVIGMLAQVGFQISPKAVELQLDKLNPASGIKKVFSAKSVLTFIQTILKAAVLCVAIWQTSLGLMPLLAAAVHQTVPNVGLISLLAIQKLFGVALLLFLTMGPLDYAIQRWQFLKDQRMTKDEIKREYKEQEGDPQTKGERKQIARELSESEPIKRVAGANVVIVNPTHYAVAISYRAGQTPLPIVVAKGMDEAAMHIRRSAERSGVPIVGNPPLARALFKVQTDCAIPEELFESVAAVLRWVQDIQGSASQPSSD